MSYSVPMPTCTCTSSQFQCCSIDNSSDWLTYSREAVIQNNNAPPDCDCDPDEEDDDDCVEFFLNGQGTGNYV